MWLKAGDTFDRRYPMGTVPIPGVKKVQPVIHIEGLLLTFYDYDC